MRVLITGGTGFVGRHLANHLEKHGHKVDMVSRRPNVGYGWEEDDLRRGVEAADGVVHLAGAGVMDERWSDARKGEILMSRTRTTALLARLCAEAERRLVSTSAVGYYGTAGMDTTFDEQAPAGDDFLGYVCREWEGALGDTPAAIVRVGVVLGMDGGALKKMLLPFKLGAGGPVGSGLQPFPWIHVEDLVRLYTWLLLHPDQVGAFNAVAPGTCDQRTFARALGKALRRPAVAPLPGFVLKLALGERATLLLDGQHVVPARAVAEGFTFEHPEVLAACQDLVSR